MVFKNIPINGCKTATALQVFLDKNDNGETFVRLMCWHYTDDGFILQSAEADVYRSTNDEVMMMRYIEDFSLTSAMFFVDSMVFHRKKI